MVDGVVRCGKGKKERKADEREMSTAIFSKDEEGRCEEDRRPEGWVEAVEEATKT